MKKKLAYIFLLILTALVSCRKDLDVQEPTENPMLKVVQASSSYVARPAIALPDGSTVLISISEVDAISGVVFFPDTELPAIISRFDAKGNLMWQRNLPEIVQTVWDVVLLKNGNIVVAGFEKIGDSKFMGLVVLNASAEILYQATEYNPQYIFNMSNGILNRVDMIELNNGNIALILNAGAPSYPRLIIYDIQLNKVFDKVYSATGIVRQGFYSQINLFQNSNGNLVIHGRYTRNWTPSFAFNMTLESETYNPLSYQSFSDTLVSSTSSLAIATNGSFVWSSSGAKKTDTLFSTLFNLRNQEHYRIGTSIKVWNSNGDSLQTSINVITGYPKKGFVSKVIECNTGGFLLLGTCNINNNQRVPSNYQIMLIKLTEDLQLEWIQYPNTFFPTVANDIIELNDGYLISATHLSFGELSRPIIFKINKQGIIK